MTGIYIRTFQRGEAGIAFRDLGCKALFKAKAFPRVHQGFNQNLERESNCAVQRGYIVLHDKILGIMRLRAG
ncbi:MAG: hypothetical protein CMO10_11110 [Thalassospira sp.]|nr:hypothetical protein [Thalassospira sp.]